MTTWIHGVIAFAFGASIGSFLNVCISRWPAGESVIRPPSRCPSCGHQIRWYENIPLLSWLALRGRCSGCGNRISVMYPAVELATGLGWLAAFMVFGPSLDALRVAVFGTILLGIAVTDARQYVIPDGFTVFGLFWVLATAIAAAVVPGAGNGITLFAGPMGALFGACTGAGVIAIAGWLGEVALRKEAMGFGDVTLMAVIGAAVGPERALLTVFVAAFIGAVVFLGIVYPVLWLRGRTRQADFQLPLVPFGVFLAPAGMVTLLWGDAMIEWYVRQIL